MTPIVHQVEHPGIRGGKFYVDSVGRIRYGERPPPDARYLSPAEHQRRAAIYRNSAAKQRDAVDRSGMRHDLELHLGEAQEWDRSAKMHDAAAAGLPWIPEASLSDFETGNPRAYKAVGAASMHLLKERVIGNRKLGLSWSSVKHGAEHVLEHLKEKVDIKATFRELKELGKEHGPVFLAYAVAIELFEDIVLPAILTHIGKPQLIPFALAFHTEPVLYPLFFAVKRWMKRRPAGPMTAGGFAKSFIVDPWGRISLAR